MKDESGDNEDDELACFKGVIVRKAESREAADVTQEVDSVAE